MLGLELGLEEVRVRVRVGPCSASYNKEYSLQDRCTLQPTRGRACYCTTLWWCTLWGVQTCMLWGVGKTELLQLSHDALGNARVHFAIQAVHHTLLDIKLVLGLGLGLR